MFSRAKSFWERNERRLSLVALSADFCGTILRSRGWTRLFDNLVLAAYLIVVFAALCLLNAHGAGHLQGALSKRGVNFAKVALPFAFGDFSVGFLSFIPVARKCSRACRFFSYSALSFWVMNSLRNTMNGLPFKCPSFSWRSFPTRRLFCRFFSAVWATVFSS